MEIFVSKKNGNGFRLPLWEKRCKTYNSEGQVIEMTKFYSFTAVLQAVLQAYPPPKTINLVILVILVKLVKLNDYM